MNFNQFLRKFSHRQNAVSKQQWPAIGELFDFFTSFGDQPFQAGRRLR
jgi:hypothetical protein